MIILGCVLTGLSTMMIGPSKLFAMAPSFTLTYVGLAIAGVFSGMINVPSYPELKEEAK